MKKLMIAMRPIETILGLIYIAVQIFVLPFLLIIVNAWLPTPFSAAALNFISFAINFICITAIFHRYLIDAAKQILLAPWQFLRCCGQGLLLYWLGSFLINLLIVALDPEFSNVNDNSIAQMTNQNYILMSVGTVLLVPVVEETLYRGVVFGQLYRKNPLVGYIVSTAIFSALHVVSYIGLYDPIRLILCFVQYWPAGICLAWSYVQSDTIWAPILIHITINQIGMLSMR